MGCSACIFNAFIVNTGNTINVIRVKRRLLGTSDAAQAPLIDSEPERHGLLHEAFSLLNNEARSSFSSFNICATMCDAEVGANTLLSCCLTLTDRSWMYKKPASKLKRSYHKFLNRPKRHLAYHCCTLWTTTCSCFTYVCALTQ